MSCVCSVVHIGRVYPGWVPGATARFNSAPLPDDATCPPCSELHSEWPWYQASGVVLDRGPVAETLAVR